MNINLINLINLYQPSSTFFLLLSFKITPVAVPIVPLVVVSILIGCTIGGWNWSVRFRRRRSLPVFRRALLGRALCRRLRSLFLRRCGRVFFCLLLLRWPLFVAAFRRAIIRARRAVVGPAVAIVAARCRAVLRYVVLLRGFFYRSGGGLRAVAVTFK